MEDEDSINVIVLDENGDVLCFSEDGRIISKPIKEVTLDNLFIFWSKDLNDLCNLSYWKSTEKFTERISSINSYSFLDLYIIDKENGKFWVG